VTQFYLWLVPFNVYFLGSGKIQQRVDGTSGKKFGGSCKKGLGKIEVKVGGKIGQNGWRVTSDKKGWGVSRKGWGRGLNLLRGLNRAKNGSGGVKL